MVAVVGLLLAVACGTTTDPLDARSRQDADGAAAAEVVGPAGSADDPLRGPVVGRDSSVSTEGSPEAAAGQQPSRGMDASRGPAADLASSRGRIPVGPGTHGVTDSAIEVGLWYINTAAANAVVGAISGDSSVIDSDFDWKKGGQHVVDHINQQGGVAGRKLEPVWYHVNEQNAATPSGRQREAQRACSYWTEDHQVFAIHAWVAAIDFQCAINANTVLLSDITAGGQASLSESMFTEYLGDLWYSATGMIADRRDRNLVDALWDHGFFGEDARVGILIEDRSNTREAVAKAMVPALARHGITPVRQVVFPDGIEAQWQNYILQLQSAGVTHVLWSATEAQAYSGTLAMRAAENQRYSPKWGLASDITPAALIALGAPEDQLANVTGMGWIPAGDVGDTSHQSPNTETCLRLEAEQPGGVGFCEDVFLLQFILERAAEVSPAGMSQALSGGAYPSVWTIGGKTAFGPDRHDGPSTYRIFTYDRTCGDAGCFVYAGPEGPLR